jgi:hypothetical protein
MSDFDFLLEIALFKKGFNEQKSTVHSFWETAAELLEDSDIRLKSLPKAWLSLRHNTFSALFIALFYLLDIPQPRLRLYARLNHCLRSWVTACDNLLDDELKEMVLTDLPADAKVFKSVHTLLLTDRIFFAFLAQALADGVITHGEMLRLSQNSLTSISASGLEEAQEEGGVDLDLSADQVLEEIHRVKTGHLFTAPLSAPLALGDLHMQDERVRHIHDGLLTLGISCQILDDLNDLAMDICDRKHNYLATLIRQGDDPGEAGRLAALYGVARGGDDPWRERIDLYKEFPKAAALALEEALTRLTRALELFRAGGMPFTFARQQTFARILTTLYGHPKALLHIRKR